MKLKIAVLAGDGIGPEVTDQAIGVLRAVASAGGHDFEFHPCLIGGAAIHKTKDPFPPETLDVCQHSDAVVLGAVGAPEFDSLPPNKRPEAGLLRLRRALGVFANLRPALCHAAIADCSPLRSEIVRGADVLVVRELLGGLYFGEPRGFGATKEGAKEAFNTMRYSEPEIERIARVAFQQAMLRRKKVTSVDKANVLETSQLWRQVVASVARDYPEVTLENMYVDACSTILVMQPLRFDVILTENLFGDILSDEAAVLSGSLGMLASASIGGTAGLFEPVHGSAPDIAGRGIANPLGAIATAALLLRHNGMEQEARDVESAVSEALDAGLRTADLLPQGEKSRACSTAEMGAAVQRALRAGMDRRQNRHAVQSGSV